MKSEKWSVKDKTRCGRNACDGPILQKPDCNKNGEDCLKNINQGKHLLPLTLKFI